MTPGGEAPDAFTDALIAARLCALDPGLGGMVLRGDGAARDVAVAALRAALPEGAPVRRLPVHADDDALFGGLDLAATLASGAAVRRRGLLAAADGGMVVVPMAERLGEATAARIAGAIDGGDVDGAATRFLLVALDDGIGDDERVPAALADRIAFRLDLTAIGRTAAAPAPPPPATHPMALDAVADAEPRHLHALVATAAALGIDSARSTQHALRAARASAAAAGRAAIADEDVALAARLVLGPLATRRPDAAEPPPPPPADAPDDRTSDGDDHPAPDALDDVVLAAALATLPPDLLARMAATTASRSATRARGGGERRRSTAHGRPLAARAGVPGGGRRLALIDTLRAAAPWQRLRGADPGRVRLRRDDLRIRRFATRAEAVTIFAVDASGSAALTRLAEAKGAVELLLAQAYVKRAQVALIAFRGTAAELLLPPTRSLARARRSLADLPGGGGTPLAAGLAAAHRLAEDARRRGRTPFLVVLTDGRANIAADGRAARVAAEADAATAARAIGTAGIAGAFVDISPRPRPDGAALATVMGARYLPLPRADAAAMHAAVTAAQRS